MITRLKVLWHAVTSYLNPHCQHPFWRSTISRHTPAKWCPQCSVVVEITEEEFRALFKRPSYALRQVSLPHQTPWEHK
jgi:hypothetical protein